MKTLFVAVTAVVLSSGAVSSAAAPGDIFRKGAQPQVLWDAGRFTEGVDTAADGSVYFSDMAVGSTTRPPQTLRYDPQTSEVTVVVADNGNSNGQKIGPDGRLWSVQTSAGGSRNLVALSLKDGKRQVVASGYAGKRFNALNDIVFDAVGTAWVTDVRYAGTEPIEQPANAVYRVDASGAVALAVTDMLAPNGIAFSPDGLRLYV